MMILNWLNRFRRPSAPTTNLDLTKTWCVHPRPGHGFGFYTREEAMRFKDAAQIALEHLYIECGGCWDGMAGTDPGYTVHCYDETTSSFSPPLAD